MQTIKTAILVGLMLLLVAPIFECTSAATTSFSLSAETAQYRYLLPAGTTFNGTINTSGTIRFWASDPNGNQIVNLGLVDDSGSFSFVAQEYGNYTLNFESNMLNSDPVQVTFTYLTNPDITSGAPSSPLNTVLISAVIIVVGSALIIVFIRFRNRKKTAGQQD